MLPYISLGPFLLTTPGLAILIGVWIGTTLVEREAAYLKANKEQVYNLVFTGLVAGIVGARLVYAARYFNTYLDDPLSLFSLNLNAVSVPGGIALALLAGTFYGIRKRLPLRPTLDALAPGLAALMISLGVAHILSGDAFGSPANVPWSIYLWDEYRHPSQIYESLFAIGIFLFIRIRPLGRPGDGTNFVTTVALTAAARLVLDVFRGDSLIWFGTIRAAQFISLIVLVSSLLLMMKLVQSEPS